MSRRTDRVAHLIQREIGNVILKELTDVRIGFVTISRVEVTTDMAFAKVHVSIMGSDKEKRDSMAGLAHSASYLRTHLAKVMKMRTVPRLQFVEDKNLEHGFRINEILNEIKPKVKPAPDDEDDEAEPDSKDG
jgi:ribosome-binding factor A